jgi:tripartite-type tricarboxylate transporter receptor subunit TctC
MKLHRRKFLRLAAYSSTLLALPRVVSALDYPARPVRIIVGFAPASGPDIVARLMGQRLSERFGQQFIVEDRPGAGGSGRVRKTNRGSNGEVGQGNQVRKRQGGLIQGAAENFRIEGL